MIPHFVATARNSLAVPKFLPPVGFIAAGTVSRAEIAEPRFVRGAAPRTVPGSLFDAKRAGLKFEEKMQKSLAALLPDYQSGPWFRFWTHLDPRSRVCQPDGIREYPSFVLIVEIKTQHCDRAWWQLRMLYAPVVERAFGKGAVVLEVVQRGDPLMVFPEPVRMISACDIEYHSRSGTPEFLLCFADSFGAEDDGK